ncbi:hypothetical protein [Pseudomonas oryzae]|uniref:Cation/multidrug efflux pump n=1 Tax=Pseudomonas oryzae TaxID=1392877 RepID=A0A1H1MNK2_9PSED|nr:hypothetical protein [Pseudomonas oryzae]SDR88413.1 hypothetical protein SAMN05216221_0563 [Pseudomonas oryzae]
MQYNGLTWAIALLALLVVMLAWRVLRRPGWFLGWLRGTCGLLILGLAGVVAVVAYDLYSYSELPPSGQSLVSLKFTAEGHQRYRVSIQEGTRERNTILDGDLWQLDARVLGWHKLATLIGLRPGYRLDALTSTYRSAAQQAVAESSRAMLGASPYGIDLWRWLRETGNGFPLFDARGARVAFLPMVDGAVFEVSLTSAGLVAEARNQAARDALAH